MEKAVETVKEEMKGLMVAFIAKAMDEIKKGASIIDALPAKKIKDKSCSDCRVESNKGDQQEYREEQFWRFHGLVPR